jgi:hypothetical protein
MAAMELQEIKHAPASPGTGVLLALQRDGVPAEDAPKLKELQTLLAADIEKYGDAALADATTLLRFLRAREHDVAEAAKMWRAAHAWREHHVRTALAECGLADDASSTEGWRWRQHADASAAVHNHRLLDGVATPDSPLICAQVGRAHAARQARPRARHGPAVGRRRGRREPRAVLGARRARRGRRRARGPGRLPPDAAGRALCGNQPVCRMH